MTKYYKPAPKSCALAVIAFLDKNKTKRFTTLQIAQSIQAEAKSVRNVLARMRELEIVFTHGKDGYQFNPNHGVKIGEEAEKKKIIIRRASKQAEMLETRHRINMANPIKQPGDNTPVPHSMAKRVTVRENYPPHRFWVDPNSVQMFRYGS